MTKQRYSSLTVYTDGGARGNPGPAAVGVVIYTPDGELEQYHEYIGHATNNIAEYTAVIRACQRLQLYETDRIDFFLDSELVVKQLNGEYRVKDASLRILYTNIISMIAQWSNVTFQHIPRAENAVADALVNQALDNRND